MKAQRMAHGSAAPDTSRDDAAHAAERSVTRRDLSTYLDRARVRLGVQKKELAYWWACDHGYVSRVLANLDPLPDYRLSQLPDELQRATLEEWARDLGVTVGRKADLTQALQALARLADDDPLNVPVRMAKCELPESER